MSRRSCFETKWLRGSWRNIFFGVTSTFVPYVKYYQRSVAMKKPERSYCNFLLHDVLYSSSVSSKRQKRTGSTFHGVSPWHRHVLASCHVTCEQSIWIIPIQFHAEWKKENMPMRHGLIQLIGRRRTDGVVICLSDRHLNVIVTTYLCDGVWSYVSRYWGWRLSGGRLRGVLWRRQRGHATKCFGWFLVVYAGTWMLKDTLAWVGKGNSR